VTVDDLVIALSQLTRRLPGVHCPDAEASFHRRLELFLDGLRAPALPADRENRESVTS
jgi:hypothetical protein